MPRRRLAATRGLPERNGDWSAGDRDRSGLAHGQTAAHRKRPSDETTIRATLARRKRATVQQAANADEVSKAIQGVAQVTEQTAAGSEEMASASEELGAQASALQQIVSRFKTT